MNTFLPTTLVGSYPQPDWLIDRAKLAGRFPPRVRAKELWRIAPEWLEQAQDDATLLAIRDQERAGLDIITDGETRRVHRRQLTRSTSSTVMSGRMGYLGSLTLTLRTRRRYPSAVIQPTRKAMAVRINRVVHVDLAAPPRTLQDPRPPSEARLIGRAKKILAWTGAAIRVGSGGDADELVWLSSPKGCLVQARILYLVPSN